MGWVWPIRVILTSRCFRSITLEVLSNLSLKVICANKIMKTEVVDDEPEHPKFEEATSTFTFPVRQLIENQL